MDALGKLFIPLICLFLVSYFGYHGMNGRYGYYAQIELGRKLARLEKKHKSLEKQKQALEHRISLLQPQSISRDLLDELVRKNLNLSDENDAIIWSNGKK